MISSSSLLDFLDRTQQIQAGVPALAMQATYSDSETDSVTDTEELGDEELLLAIREVDDIPSVSLNDRIVSNDSATVNNSSSPDEETIEKELIRFKHNPYELYEVVKKYLSEKEGRVKNLAFSFLSKAVDMPITKWDRSRRVDLQSRIARSEAATLVARGYHTGIGLEHDDDRAMHYYKLAKGKLTSDKDKRNIVGINCFEAASFLREIAVERKEPSLLLKSIKWFQQSSLAKYSPFQGGLSEVAENFWLLSQTDACSSEERIKYNLESYAHCLRVLNINCSTFSERVMSKKIKEVPASRAFVTLGHLFHYGYYENERGCMQTNPTLSLLCYKKAFKAGRLNVILEAIDVSGFIEESSKEFETKRGIQALLLSLKEIRDQASPEEVQKMEALLEAAEEKFNSKWGACAAASSSIPPPKRQRT